MVGVLPALAPALVLLPHETVVAWLSTLVFMTGLPRGPGLPWLTRRGAGAGDGVMRRLLPLEEAQ